MKCPRCQKSLWFPHSVCPFCQATLAPAQPPAPVAEDAEAPPDDTTLWVTVKSCQSLPAADAVRGQLEAAGFTTLIPDESLMQSVAWNLNAYGFVRVQVLAAQAEAALKALASWEAETASVTAEQDAARANLPLSWPMCALAFLLPATCCPGMGMMLMARSGYLKQDCQRKAADLGVWFIVGIIFWALVTFAATAYWGTRTSPGR